MPTYSIQAPDGHTYSIEGPDGASQQDVINAVLAQHPEAGNPPAEKKPESGIMAALGSGFRGGLGEAAESAGAFAGLKGLQAFGKRQQEQAEKNYAPTTDEQVAAAGKEGLLSDLGMSAKQFLEPYAKSAGSIAGRFGAPMVAAPIVVAGLPEELAAAPFLAGGLGAVGLGTVGAAAGAGAMALADAPIEIGQKKLERERAGLPPDPLKDIQYGLTATALNTLSGSVLSGPIKGILGRSAAQQAAELAPRVLAGEITSQEAAGQISGLLKNVLHGTAENAIVGSGMMVGNEALSRAALGQDLTSPEAQSKYMEAVKGALTLAPMFGLAHGIGARGAAERTLGEAADARTALNLKAQKILDDKAAADAEAYKQSQPYADEITQKYADLQNTFTGLRAQASVKVDPTDLAGLARVAEAKQSLKDFMADDETKNTIQEFNRLRKLQPQAPATAPVTEATKPVTETTTPTAPTVDPRQQLADINAKIQNLQIQAQGATGAQLIDFGKQHAELKTQQAEAQKAVDALPPAPPAPPTPAQLNAQIKRRTTARDKALADGDIDVAAKHQQKIDELTKQLPAPAPVAENAPAETAAPTTATQAPAAPKPKAPQPLKPYTGIAEQSLMFPETGKAESTVNLGQGKQPAKSRQDLIAEFQAARQVRDRLGMQNAIEQMRVLKEQSQLRSETARGVNAPKGELTSAELAQNILGQKLTATGTQPASRELTNAKRAKATPESLRKQIEELPEKLAPKDEQLLNRLRADFDEFVADPDRAELAAGWLHDVRTGVETHRARDIENELDVLEAKKEHAAPTLFGAEETPVVEGPRKPLPVIGYSAEALPSKPAVQKKVAPVRAPKKVPLAKLEAEDAAKRKAENERAERLAAIPGESISHEAYRKALELNDGADERLVELEAKAADETLPKPTRDKAKREIKKIKAAREYLAGSHEGLAEVRASAEAALKKLDDKIAHQEKLVAENPTKSRKQELARSKREKKKLEGQIGSYKERAERMPLNTPTERAAKEADARAERFMSMQTALNVEGTTGKLPPREIGPEVRKAQAAGNIRTGNTETEGERIINPGLKPEQGGAVRQPTPAEMRQIIREASELANERLKANKPLTAEQLYDLDVAHQGSLLEAAVNLRAGLERNKRELQEKMDFAANSPNLNEKNTILRAARELEMQRINGDLYVAKENERQIQQRFEGKQKPPAPAEAPVVETKTKAKKATTKKAAATKPKRSRTQDVISDVYAGEEFSEARGVEVESPDLTDTQRQHIANNDIRATLRDLADDDSSSPINRAVARKLSLLLDNTDIHAIDNLKDENGAPILGQAISTEVQLHATEGMSQEVLLHEGTHAAVDRVLAMPEDRLSPTQLAAKRELNALFEAAKRDPSITSMNAKSSLKEFAAEVLSNRNLQEQLRGKKWKLSDAMRGFTSAILRLLGFTKNETDTMLGASIKSVEALMVPSSKRGLTSERAINAISAKGEGVPRSSSVKDIAALHNGSNSMKQFADQFGTDIKAKDRTPEDAERIGQQHLDDMTKAVDGALAKRIRRLDPEAAEKLNERAKAVRDYIAIPTLDSLDYRVRMPDGKMYDENNPLHYIESTVADQMYLKAKTDPSIRLSEAGDVGNKRLNDYLDLLEELQNSKDFTSVERALIAKAAGKFSVISDDNGRLKLVDIGADNRHNVAVVSAADAAFIVQKLREGLPLKKAFLEGLQDNADRNVKQNLATHKTGWQKFEQSNTEKAAQELAAGAAGTPWCTAREGHARGQIAKGDFYIYYDNGRPEVAVRMEGNRIGEVRGNSPSQSINQKQQQIAEDFLRAKKFAGHEAYIQEFAKKNALLTLAKDAESLKPEQMMMFNLSDISNSDVGNFLNFPHLDGHERGIRSDPTNSVVEFFKEKLVAAGEKAMEAGYYPTRVEVGSSYKKGVLTTRFNGEEREVASTNIKAVTRLNVPTYADTIDSSKFPELSFVNGLSIGVDAAFPKLAKINMLSVKDDVKLHLPRNAKISLVETGATKPSTLSVRGADVIEQVVVSDYADRELTVKAPDARYVPKEATYEESYNWVLGKVINDVGVMAKYVDDDAVIAALATRMPNAIRTEFELSTSTQSAKYILSEAIDNNARSLKDYAAVNKAINKFWGTTDTYDKLPEKFGTIDAPNRIAENPPYGDLTEAPEAPSYARVAKYNPELKEAGEMAERVVDTERPLTEKLNSNAFGRAAKEFEIKAVDQYAGVLHHAKQMEQLAGSQMQYYLRMVGQRLNLLGQAVGRGFPELKKIVRPDGRNEWLYESKDGSAALVHVAQKLQAANKLTGSEAATNNLFSLYEIAKRANDVGIDKMNYSPDITKAKLDNAIKQIKAVPGLSAIFDDAHESYRDFNKDGIKFAVSTGALSKELGAKLLVNKDYVPYYRESPDGTVSLWMGNESITKVGNVKDQPYLHELVGGNTRIVDFTTSSVRNANMLLDMGLRNQATKNVANELKKIGLAEIRKGQTRARPNIIQFKVDGADYYAVIESTPDMPAELLVKGMAGIPVQTSALLNMVGAPSRLLRHMFVANPISAGRILFKDTVSSAMVGGSNFDGISAAFKNVGDNLMEKRGLSGGETFTGLPEDLSKILRQVQTGKPGWENLLAKGYAMHAKADAMTRQIRYESYRKQGLSEMEASLQALESMNFTRRGISPSLHLLSAINPFMNSQIQGVNTLVKALRGNMPFNEKLKIREKIIQRGMMLAGATMLYTTLMQDDDTYKKATPEQRYNNFLVPFPGLDEKVRVPIPFEAGLLFKSVPEALVNYLHGHDKDAATGMRMIIQKMIPGGDSEYVPQILKPAIEVGLGKSFYTGRDIESKHEQSLVPGERSRDTTSGLAIAMGHSLGIDPIMVDHLINGYTGSLGLAVTKMASSIVFGGQPGVQPEKTLSQEPIIGTLFQPKDAGNIVEEGYQTMKEAKQVQDTVKDLIAKNRIAEAKAFLEKNATEYARADLEPKFASAMNQTQKALQAIAASTTMSPAEKRAEIDKIKALRSKIAEQVMEAADKTKRP